MTSTRVTWFC